MALALVGPQSIEELTRMAYKYFSYIPSAAEAGTSNESVVDPAPVLRSFISDSSATFPFTQTGKVIRIRPVKEVRDLSLMFALPPTRRLYRSNPIRLISHLINQKSKGSLFAYLQAKGWVSSIGGYTRTSFEDFAVFEISAALTPEGLERWEDVVEHIFLHLKMVQNSEPGELRRIWTEIQTMNKLEFQYSDKSSPYDLATETAENMLNFKMQHVFSAGQVLDAFDYELFQQFSSMLSTPDNAIITIRSPTFDDIPSDRSMAISDAEGSNEMLKYERWYGVPYAETPLNFKLIESWKGLNDAVTTKTMLPTANPFIPYDLVTQQITVKKRKLRSSPPTVVQESSHNTLSRMQVWHSSDEAFCTPKSIINILIDSPYCSGGHPVNSLIRSIFAQAYAEKYYPSSFAGLSYSAILSNRGVLLSVIGFSSKLVEFAKDLANTFCSNEFWENVPESIFVNCKDSLVRSIAGLTKERPDSLCDLFLRYLLQEGTWLPEVRLKAAESISRDDVGACISKAFLRSKVTVYAHGDLCSSAVVDFSQELNPLLGKQVDYDTLQALQDENGFGIDPPRYKARALNRGHHRIILKGFNPDDENSAIVCHFQTTTRNPKAAASLLVLQKLLSEPLFYELRTQKSLGYIVSLGISSYGSGLKAMRGFSIRVVSNKFTPWEMEKAIGDFLSSQKSVMAEYSQDYIRGITEALVKIIEDPPTSYLDEAELFWDSIVDDTPFDWAQQVVAALRNLTLVDVQNAAEEWLFDPLTRKTVSSMIFGSKHEAATAQPVSEQSSGKASAFPIASAHHILSLEDLSTFRESLTLVN